MSSGGLLVAGRSTEPLSASGLGSEKLSLPALQSKMKIYPEGYETELGLLYSQYNSALELFQQHAALNFTSVSSSGICADPNIDKDPGDRAMFSAHVTPFYPKQLGRFLRIMIAALLFLLDFEKIEDADTDDSDTSSSKDDSVLGFIG